MTQPCRGRLLIVDDESAQLRALCETLSSEGYTVRGFESPRAALDVLKRGAYDLLLTDLMMPEMDGIELIAAVRDIDRELGSIVMTGHGTIDTAVGAMRGGALDYILKPFRLNVILAVVARALDLQRLRRENAALLERERRQAEELATAYQDLESFTYSISHDLRAPLVFVRGFAEKLEREFGPQLGERGRQMTRLISDGSNSMDEMIVGLLAFSRAGRQPLHREPVDMAVLARDALDEALALYEGPEPAVDLGPLPRAAADPGVMRHVWSNLISNALKYSARRAHPEIHIAGRVQGGEAVYTVQDNGVGFDADQAERIFGVFKRLHNDEDFPGTGVGLAIAQRIVSRHGGRIWAQGSPDAGARIEFSLPTAA